MTEKSLRTAPPHGDYGTGSSDGAGSPPLNPAPRRERVLPLVILSLVLILFAGKDGFLLARHSVPVGLDGYYYVVQVRSFLEDGDFYYDTRTPVVMYLMAAAARLYGDIIPAVKATSLILHLGLSVALFALISSLTGSRWLGLLAAFISGASAVHLLWVEEFVKQLGGLTFFAFGAACAARQPKSTFWRLAAVALIAISLFCHKSVIFLILTLASLALLFHTMHKVRTSPMSALKISALLVFALSLPAAAARLPSLLPQQLSETLLLSPRSPFTITAFEEKLILLFLAPAGLALCLRRGGTGSRRAARYAIGVAALFSVLFTLNPFLDHGEELLTISQRLDLLAHLQISVLLPGVVWLLNSRVTSAVMASAALLLLILGNSSLPIGLRDGFLARREALLNDLTRVGPMLPADSLVIAPHGDEFLVTYATRLPSRQSASENQDGRRRVLWLLFEAPCREGPGVTLVARKGRCTLLVTENSPISLTESEKRQVLRVNSHLRKAPAEILKQVLL